MQVVSSINDGNIVKIHKAWINARLVPKDFNLLQTRGRVVVAKEMLGNKTDDPTFIKQILRKSQNSLKAPKAIPAEAYIKCMGNWISVGKLILTRKEPI